MPISTNLSITEISQLSQSSARSYTCGADHNVKLLFRGIMSLPEQLREQMYMDITLEEIFIQSMELPTRSTLIRNTGAIYQKAFLTLHIL